MLSQAADLYAVAAQAAAQVDRARQSAKASVQAALSQKPKLKLHVTLDAPKVAIPIPAVPGPADGAQLASSPLAGHLLPAQPDHSSLATSSVATYS